MERRPISRVRTFGHCAICGERRTLTEDHVPPTGALMARRLVVRPLLDDLRDGQGRGRLVQGGIAFRTICAECNENRLGRQYDPELKRLCADLERAASAASDLRVALPNPVRLSCRPQRIGRAVLGHLMAALQPGETGKPHRDSPFFDALRGYVLNPARPLPASLRIYCWYYPHGRIVVARSLGKWMPGHATFVSDTLKFPPIAFWVVFRPPDMLTVPASDLLPDRTIGLDAEELVPFEMREPLDARLPEAPDDRWGGNTFFGGDVGLVATPRRLLPRKRRRRRGRRG